MNKRLAVDSNNTNRNFRNMAIASAIANKDVDELKRLEKAGLEEVATMSQALDDLRREIKYTDDIAQPRLESLTFGPRGTIKQVLVADDWSRAETKPMERWSIGGGSSVGLPGISVAVAVTAGQEKVLGTNDLMNIAWLSRGIELSKAVARVRVPGGFGTGFLIGPGLLLTNNHVIPDAATAGDSRTFAEFNLQQNWQGTVQPSKSFKIVADAFQTSVGLDYSIVRVQGKPEDEFGFIEISDFALPGMNENIQIIQHPSGGPKQIALQNNIVTRIEGNFVRYTTDTEPGSSGSPCFNREWKLVGLHHSGGDLPLSSGGSEFINEGVLISSIVHDALEILQLSDPLQELVFGPLLPILTQVISSREAAFPYTWVLNGYPGFSSALGRNLLLKIGDEGVPNDGAEIAPLIAAAIGVAAGAGIQILARKLEVASSKENGSSVIGKIKAIVDDVIKTAKDSRQVYQGLVARVNDLKNYMSRVIAESDIANTSEQTSEVFPIAVAAFLAGVTAGAAAARR